MPDDADIATAKPAVGGRPLATIATTAISIASLFVSGTALSVTITQNDLARKYNALSVAPKLDWRTGSDAVGVVSLRLVNVGLGPASVSNVQLMWNGQSLGLSGAASCAELDAVLGRQDRATWETYCFTVGELAQSKIYMKDDEVLELYRSSPVAGSPAEGAPAPDIVGHLTIRADYCSLYEKCETLSNELP